MPEWRPDIMSGEEKTVRDPRDDGDRASRTISWPQTRPPLERDRDIATRQGLRTRHDVDYPRQSDRFTCRLLARPASAPLTPEQIILTKVSAMLAPFQYSADSGSTASTRIAGSL